MQLRPHLPQVGQPHTGLDQEGQVEEGVSVVAPSGDMDGSRSRVTDISESCRDGVL